MSTATTTAAARKTTTRKPAAKKPVVVIEDYTVQRQDIEFSRTVKTPCGHTLQASIRLNAYAFQSHAIIERWNGEKWMKVSSIPSGDMATVKGSSVYQPNAAAHAKPYFELDFNTLLARALAIVS